MARVDSPARRGRIEVFPIGRHGRLRHRRDHLAGSSLQSKSIRREIDVSRHSGVLGYPGNGPDHHRPGGERPRGRGHRRGAGVDESDRADRRHRGIGDQPLQTPGGDTNPGLHPDAATPDPYHRRMRLADGLVCANAGRAALVPSVHPGRLQGINLQCIHAADIQDRRVWPDHRAHRVLSGNAHTRRRRGRGPRSHKLGGPGIALPYTGRRCAGEIHSRCLSITADARVRDTNMATAYDIAMKQGRPEEDGSAPVVAVENLHKSFEGHKVLNGISLSVSRGETLAVLGRSGTGKSVLLRLIIGIEKPYSGSIRIHGRNIVGLALDRVGEIRKKMGFLFQHAALYDSLTVAENVAFPLEHHRRDMSRSERGERVKRLLAEVGMEGDFGKMPSDISGGMQKRVGLARALALEPEILLLDEPTAGLDPISSAEIDDLILKLQRERQMASIVVTHDLHSARIIANRLALLDQGNVVIEGAFEDLQQSEGALVKEFLKLS